MSENIKTWKRRLDDSNANIGDGIDMDNPIVLAMKAENANLRAALTKAEAELDDWIHTNKIDVLQRDLRAALAQRAKPVTNNHRHSEVYVADLEDSLEQIAALLGVTGGADDLLAKVRQVAAKPVTGSIEELIGDYWAIAYSEGKTGISRGDDANEVLHRLRQVIDAQRAPADEAQGAVARIAEDYQHTLEQIAVGDATTPRQAAEEALVKSGHWHPAQPAAEEVTMLKRQIHNLQQHIEGYCPPVGSPEWIVNDLGELGVKVGNAFYFLYKGDNIQYETGLHDDGTPMMWRKVGKREFGETCWPLQWVLAGRNQSQKRYTLELVYRPGLSHGKPGDCDWKPLPTAEEVTDAGLRMVKFIEALDVKLAADGFDTDQRRRIVAAMMETSVPVVPPDRSRQSGNAGEGVARHELSEAEKSALAEAAKTGATIAEMDGGGIMFINRGEQPGDYDFPTCPTCHGSGHADDVAEHAKRAEPDERALFEAWRNSLGGSQDDGIAVKFVPTLPPIAWEAWKAGRAALQQQAGGDALDAARYRWLRMRDWFDGPLCVLRNPKKVLTEGRGLGADCPSRERLDEAIDAQIAAAPTLGGAK